MTLSAIVSLLQFPIFTLIKGPLQNNPFYVNVMLVLVTLLTLARPPLPGAPGVLPARSNSWHNRLVQKPSLVSPSNAFACLSWRTDPVSRKTVSTQGTCVKWPVFSLK
ncbi:solute carrier family 43 member 3 [Phyllostomus discolor]|uniref:Solute carrier family 43 member 3 n=1 Tax=Phyllostomus discolor TaxID=89673 RepID=A0A834E9L7_9CHIR|nr:solute carrier family 43 member 3 [Phyllostomus discolor]